ncbi:MAG: NADPH-dependent FMN reductase [Deferrisomatales bacterium]
MTAPRVLLVVGSPRGTRSTSRALGEYLARRLAGHSAATGELRLVEALRSPGGTEEFLRRAEEADLVFLSFPLYWDSLPAVTVRGLEAWRDRRAAAAAPRRGRFAALCNSGFPEARQCATALAICARFAREAGLDWAGGLALGGGAALDGRDLDQAGGRARHARRALNLAAAALAAGRDVPPEAVKLMARPFVPAWAYTLVGSWGWRRQARVHGSHRDLGRRPYEP